ncbi:MAG: TolC family protein [Planctomycetes bacterium]|nr:TolC family protein [Planctomycetota bacterium]
MLPLVVAAAVAFAPGCTLQRQGVEEVASALERQAQHAPGEAEAYARTPAQPTAEFVRPADGAGPQPDPQGLREFIVRALAENPSIKAAQDRARAQAERIAQVMALPDPMLKTKTLPEPIRTAEGDNFFILGVSQKLPVPEKLDRAGRMALDETRMALARLNETRLSVIAQVKRAYFQLYVIDKSLAVTAENQQLLRGLIDVARAQVAAGRRAQDDVLRVQVETSKLQADLIVLRQRRVSVAASLNRLLDRPSATSIATPMDFGIRQADLSLDDLLARAARANPALKRLERQIDREQHAVELARLAYWPDFTVGFEWLSMEPRDAFQPPRNPETGKRPTVSRMSERGSDNWAVTFGFNLPIWFDKIEAGIREARYRLAATRREYDAARNRVDFEIADALERVRSQRALAVLFDGTIIPQARQTYQVSQASYVAGRSDFLYVIDNWQKWLVFTVQYYRSLGELERSVADLEQAIGMSLTESGAAP